MNKKVVAGVTAILITLSVTAIGAYADVAHAHDGGTKACQSHSNTKICWGTTTHIDTATREDAWGYTRARFEWGSTISADTMRNLGLGHSSANTNSDQDISGGHGCVGYDSLYVGRTYYGAGSPPSSDASITGTFESSEENSGVVAYKVNVETGETTLIVGGEK